MTTDKRILVVDDDEQICELVREFLADQGFGVECATSGAEARRALAAGPVDLLVMDPLMRGERGLDLADEAAAAGAAVILVSGEPEYMEIVDLSPHPSLHKPFRLGELHDLVLAALVCPPPRDTQSPERSGCPAS